MSDAVVTWGAIVAAVGVLGTIITFWTRYSDRITKAEAAAAAAATTAAAAVAEVKRTSEIAIAEARREANQAASAHAAELAAKLYQVEIWARDEFVRKTSFENVIRRLEAGFTELRTDIGGRLDRMTDRIEAVKAGPHQ
ncbi:Tfp pilus assembly protein PilE [Bradyrhizobium sp. USDA 4503]